MSVYLLTVLNHEHNVHDKVYGHETFKQIKIGDNIIRYEKQHIPITENLINENRLVEKILGFTNLLCTLSIVLKITVQTYHTGKTYWKSVWAYFELVYACCCCAMAIMNILEYDET